MEPNALKYLQKYSFYAHLTLRRSNTCKNTGISGAHARMEPNALKYLHKSRYFPKMPVEAHE